MRHSVNTELLQNALNYMSTKPYSEVNSLITKILADAYILPTDENQQVETPTEPSLEKETESALIHPEI